MSEIITFEVDGEVRGKMRPRFSTVHGYAQTYSAPKEVAYENWVKLCYQREAQAKHFKGFEDKPIFMSIIIEKAVPKSTSKKRRKMMLDNEIPNVSKPDIDNVVKTIMDALNKIAYNDDKQVVEIHVSKFYSLDDRAIITMGDYVSNKSFFYSSCYEDIDFTSKLVHQGIPEDDYELPFPDEA